MTSLITKMDIILNLKTKQATLISQVMFYCLVTLMVLLPLSLNATSLTEAPRPSFSFITDAEKKPLPEIKEETIVNSSSETPLLPKVIEPSEITPPSKIEPLQVPINQEKAKLVIVIDDLGYIKRDLQVLMLPVTVAIIPTGPYATERAQMAFENDREILIHLPMLPFNHSNLETDTLTPDMSQAEIARIIEQSILSVPHAVGINNHTGSEMTANLEGMKRVFHALSDKPIFFLDSLTTGKSQVLAAALEFNHPVLVRDVFLDNIQTEQAVNQQFELALSTARKKGSAIAIGHPHQATINVLKRRLADLPEDIELVTLQTLLNSKKTHASDTP